MLDFRKKKWLKLEDGDSVTGPREKECPLPTASHVGTWRLSAMCNVGTTGGDRSGAG